MKRRLIAYLCLLSLLAGGLFLTRSLQLPATPQDSQRSPAGGVRFQKDSAESNQRHVSRPVSAVHTAAVRDLPDKALDEPVLDREVNPRIIWNSVPNRPVEGTIDPLLAKQANARAATDAAFLTPIKNQNGQGYTFVNPPDVSGDVGPNHFVQAINAGGGTSVIIYDKDLNVLKSAFSLDALGSGNCSSGYGDPIILYDRLADRWFLSEFSQNGNQLCLYVSKTADPTGEYYHYAFTGANGFPDYPKYGVWSDAYYAGTNEPGVPTIYAFDRNRMLTGASATYQSFNISRLSGFGFQMLMPSDLDGATPPPTGAPNYFMRHRDTESHGSGNCPNGGGLDCLEIFELKVDWDNSANSAVTGPIIVPTSEFDSNLCGLSSFECIRQSGSSVLLDPLREVIMQRLQYRNFGSYETLVGNFSTDASGTDRAGIRWFELRKVGSGSWTLHQEGTYSPDTHSRWMGSAAMDGSGNIAVAYNVSSNTMHPSLRYAGRLASDPQGTLPQGEGILINGSAPNGSFRYGDYSQISVDPTDDCTFWFTGQYNPSSQWNTRIASFRFDNCGTPTVTIGAETDSLEICEGNSAEYTLNITEQNGYTNPLTLSLSGIDATSEFSLNPISTYPSTSILTLSDVVSGTHTFNVIGSGTDLETQKELSLAVIPSTIDAFTTTTPTSGMAKQPTRNLTLSWQAATNATSYTLEVAKDIQFNDVIVSETGLSSTSYTLNTLEPLTLYYWRITAVNSCNGSQQTNISVFGTSSVLNSCSLPAIDIPDNSSDGVSDSQTVTLDGTIIDLNVAIKAQHPYVGDLIMDLKHVETNTTVTLINQPINPNGNGLCPGDNIDVILDDEATDAAETTCNSDPALDGSLQPNGSLSDFDGEAYSGTWELTARDNAENDEGTLVEWCLAFETTPDEVGNDFGDLPDSYGIAIHGGDGALTLGAKWTADSQTVLGQDDESDDGLSIPFLSRGQASTVYATVLGETTGDHAWLQVWFDWGNDGSFEPDDLVYNGQAEVGLNSFPMSPPSSYDDQQAVNYRFRLFDSETEPAGGVQPVGVADSGEVSDGTLPSVKRVWLPIILR